MNLIEAYPFLRENRGRPLGVLKAEYQQRFPDYLPYDMRINKGGVGQFLEKLIGLENTNRRTDFLDGELKTNKVDASGKPLETMFISQISNSFDDLISDNLSFSDSWIYNKIRNMLYVPICKVGNITDNWYIQAAYHICLDDNPTVYEQLESDFLAIRHQLKTHIETSCDGFIHTSNGSFIQIRSKDSKRSNGNYNPIYSSVYNRFISNKNHAFYFKKEFMDAVRCGNLNVIQIA
ncbi:MAG: MutH/Sau3AI family endonuclease [Eikenella sp.]|nr:MutH/Sau3AI family endonuclease [Eikenella sp.]